MVTMILGFIAIGGQACGASLAPGMMPPGTMVPMQVGMIPGSLATIDGGGLIMAVGIAGVGTILTGAVLMFIMLEAIHAA